MIVNFFKKICVTFLHYHFYAYVTIILIDLLIIFHHRRTAQWLNVVYSGL